MPKAFAIMSFKEEYRDVYIQAIKPAMDDIHCKCKRVDDSDNPGVITSEIVREIIQSELVIAELSEPSLNVFYELGISHAVGSKTIAIIQQDRMNEVPFDISTMRIIAYTPNKDGFLLLKSKLKDVAKELLNRLNDDPNNIVQEAGNEFFNQRKKIDEILKDLQTQRIRIKNFSETLKLIQGNTLQDNSAIADQLIVKMINKLPSKKNRILASICGAGCVGKSTFARLIKERVEKHNKNIFSVSILSTDSYMLSRAERIYRNILGFDPRSHNLDQLQLDVVSLLDGKEIKIKPYSHETGEHGEEKVIYPADVLLLEGVYSFYPKLIPAGRTQNYFIYADKQQIKGMKFIADCMGRNYDVISAFRHSEIEYEGYEKHILPYLRLADEVITISDYWKYISSVSIPPPLTAR